MARGPVDKVTSGGSHEELLRRERRITAWCESLATEISRAALEAGVPHLPLLPERPMEPAHDTGIRLVGSAAWQRRIRLTAQDSPDNVAAPIVALAS